MCHKFLLIFAILKLRIYKNGIVWFETHLFAEWTWLNEAYFVAVLYCWYSMSNWNDDFLTGNPVQSLLNQLLVAVVQGWAGFIEQYHLWILEKSSRDCKALLLASRQLTPSVTHKWLQSFFKFLHEVCDLSLLHCTPQFFFGCYWLSNK